MGNGTVAVVTLQLGSVRTNDSLHRYKLPSAILQYDDKILKSLNVDASSLLLRRQFLPTVLCFHFTKSEITKFTRQSIFLTNILFSIIFRLLCNK